MTFRMYLWLYVSNNAFTVVLLVERIKLATFVILDSAFYHFVCLFGIVGFWKHVKVTCEALRDLVPFVQFKKRENTHGILLLLLKLQA